MRDLPHLFQVIYAHWHVFVGKNTGGKVQSHSESILKTIQESNITYKRKLKKKYHEKFTSALLIVASSVLIIIAVCW